MTPELVSLEQAKAHLRLVGTTEDEDIQLKLDQATALVLDYINQRVDETEAAAWAGTIASWTDETAPPQVQAAILIQCAELYRFRGDDAAQDEPKLVYGYLAPRVVNLLHRLRDPALA
jgi:hypothetical protein